MCKHNNNKKEKTERKKKEKRTEHPGILQATNS
jgi:hypothetical protein